MLKPIASPWRFEFFKTQVFHFIIIFEDPGSDSGFPFLFSFEVSGSDSSFLSDSTLVLKPVISLKIRVFQNSGFPFYHYIWRSEFRLRFSLFIFVWSLGFRLALPIGFNARVETDRFFEDSSFSKLGFSILSLFLKIRVPTRVFSFYFRLKSRVPTRASYQIQRSCWNRSFLWRFEFFKTRVFHFIIIFEDPSSDSGFPFLFFVWSLGFRLELPIGFNPRVETDRFFEDSSFSKLGFSSLSFFLKIRVPTRVFPFYFCLKSRASDSSFLSDSTLVLKPIVSLKIRVFQNSGFAFYHYFWRSGFRLGFYLFIFVWSLGFRLELPIRFNARVETDRFFEDSSFSKLEFSILLLFFKIRVPTRVSPFYFRLNSRASDSSFLSDSTLVLKPIVYLKIRVFYKLGFSILSLFLEIRVSTRVFAFYFRLKSRVPTRASYRIQRSCWNRSFLWRFEFFKTQVFHSIIIFEDPGSDSGFPFLFSFEASGSDSSFLSDSTLVLKLIVSLKIRVFQNWGFPFYHYFWRSGFRLGFSLFIFVWSLGFRVELPIRFNARVETDRFFEDSSFSKLGFSILSLFLKIRVSTRVLLFYFRLKSRVPTRASYRIQRSVLKPIVSLKIRVFQNSGFPFYHYFCRSGFRLGFRLELPIGFNARVETDRFFEDSSSSKLGFSILLLFFKIRVLTRVFPFIFVWSLGFRLELPIGFNARVETDRFFEDSSFSKLGFSILSLFLKIRVLTRVLPFYFRLKSRVPTRASYQIQRSCWNRSYLWRFEFFKTPVFHFIIIFEDPGSDSGFTFLFSFEVSGSDSSFLLYSTLVLKPIVSLKIRVFQNSGFQFYYYFLRSGFRLGFSLFTFVWSLGFRLELPIGFNARVETDHFLEDSSFSKLGFSILSLYLKIRVPTQVFPFYFCLKSRVPTRASYRIHARVETDRFFEDSSFSKLGFSILSLFLKIRVPTRVFSFYFV